MKRGWPITIMAALTLGSACASQPPTGQTAPSSGHDVTYVELPGGIPQDVAVGEGAVWVASGRGDGGSILRVDPETNRIVAVIDVEGHHPNRLAVADGVVWATTGGEGSGAILRVDASTNRLVQIIRVPGGPEDIVVVDGAPWVSTLLPLEQGRILRLDPQTNELSTIARLDRGVSDLAAGAGAVWAVAGGGKEGQVVKVHPGTGEVLSTLQLDNRNYWNRIAAGEGSVWVASQIPEGAGNEIGRERGDENLTVDGVSVVKIDPVTVEVDREPSLVGYGYSFIAVGAGAVWVWHGGNEVSRIDPDRGAEVAVIPVRDGGRLAAGFEAVWLAGVDGLVRISLR